MDTNFTLREMKPEDLEKVIDLWKRTPGVGLSKADSPDCLLHYLERNPGLSLVATDPGGALIGAALCGHDGRRGFLYHLAVESRFRKNGVASAIVDRSLKLLGEQGIDRCTIWVYADNEKGQEFWTHRGWKMRNDLVLMQKDTL
jgi:ribosomal protein S18 acetylase RimI-like enzyme